MLCLWLCPPQKPTVNALVRAVDAYAYLCDEIALRERKREKDTLFLWLCLFWVLAGIRSAHHQLMPCLGLEKNSFDWNDEREYQNYENRQPSQQPEPRVLLACKRPGLVSMPPTHCTEHKGICTTRSYPIGTTFSPYFACCASVFYAKPFLLSHYSYLSVPSHVPKKYHNNTMCCVLLCVWVERDWEMVWLKGKRMCDQTLNLFRNVFTQ